MPVELPVAGPARRGRAPREEAERHSARTALIDAGLAAMTEKGFSAVGLSSLLAAAGVPKGSFYHYFDSKEAFGSALIEAYAAYFAARLDRWFLDASMTPIERLRGFVRDAEAGMARHHFRRGCLIGNLGQEIGALPEGMRAQLLNVLLDWQARTAACLRLAQDAGEVDPAHDCDGLAAFFWTGWEGAVLRAKLEGRPEPMTSFAEGFFMLVRKPAHSNQ